MAARPGFEHDIFISYSHIDNESMRSSEEGWVSTFHNVLGKRVSQLFGRRVSIWRDDTGIPAGAFLNESILEALHSSALLVVILSPSYIQSEWTRTELMEFVRADEEIEGRLFKVIKTPVPLEQQPEVLRSFLGYPYYEEDKNGRVREFDYEGDTREEYFNRLDELAYDIVNRLNALRGDSPAQEQTRGSSSFEFIDLPKEIQKSKAKKRKGEEAPTPAAESDDTGAAPSAPSPAPPSQVLDLDLAANEPEPARLVSAHLHSDMWTLDDRLGYSLYAKAIGEFIHHKSTSPPLTIGIYAPWGQGKTTLMRLIELKLKELANKKNAEKRGADAQFVSPTALTTVKQLINWLDKPEVPELKKLSYPTVWFNAWKYQNSDQVWAGLAHCIIDDLVSQIDSPLEREKFWLLLQAKRLDFNKIREDIHVSVVQHFLTPSLIFVGIVTIIIALGVLSVLSGFIASWFIGGGIAVVGPLLASLFRWAWEKRKVLNKPLEGDLAKYVNKPDYESKRGFFSEVEDDIRRVFALLVNPEEPAVVFVDDLDRCSPGKIAEVIEAINLFLSGDFPNAYFILGMDAQAVANSLEVAHEKLAAKMQKTTKRYGSMGWYFMEKMVQLPFVIPGITDDQRDDYLFELFTTEDDHPKASENEVREIEQQANKLIAEEPAGLIIEKISAQVPLEKLDRSTRRELEEKAIKKGAESFTDDSREIRQHLERYAPYLGNKPRTIKRFVNLYRFYRMAQWARQLQKLEVADPAALGRWIVIMLRWPQLVRWIQWEGEAGLLATDKPEDKAKNIEELAENAKAFSDWGKALNDKGIAEVSWLREEALYRYLRLKLDDNEKLYKAVEVGVW